MLIPYLIFGTALVLGIAGSYSDLKIREVSNWVSYGLIFSLLGLRVFYAFYYNDFTSLRFALIGGGFFLALGLMFFYSQQWGGADVKFLAAMGIGFGSLLPGFSPMFVSIWPFFVTYLLNFFMVMVVYAVAYAFYNSYKNPKVMVDFKASLNKYELLLGSFLILVFLLLGFYQTLFFLILLMPVLWFLSKFLKSVEENCMYKLTSVGKLVEFDIPRKDVKVGKKVLVSSKDPNGMTLEQIKEITEFAKKNKIPKKMDVRWGLPSVPAFPVALVISVVFGDVMFALIEYIAL